LKTRRSRGNMDVRLQNGTLVIINTIRLETYLAGTVEPELGSLRFPPAALEAQIIASRSWVLAMKDHHEKEDYQFCDTDHCQVYAGQKKFPANFQRALASARGRYLRFAGRPAAGFFHHSCGGKTASYVDVWPGKDIPYLNRVTDVPHKGFGGVGGEWQVRIPRKDVVQMLRSYGWLQTHDPLIALGVIRSDASGRARQILVRGNSSRWVSGNEFRQALNRLKGTEAVRSTLFQVQLGRDHVLIKGKGWGHGVGLCQTGAVTMANKGKTAKQILAHYFPGAELAKAR
jgi:stage II sporulation protein D